ncbi:hypothetical protein C8255_06280 [filamentous cyanobacterium CCP3]|nr:hypothetical protein C8255_06280 [filamentous cyanobacterium CCP3]
MPQAPRQGQTSATYFDNAALITQDFYTNKPQHILFTHQAAGQNTSSAVWCDGLILTGRE